MNWYTIDPDLPALPFAFNGNAVTQRFEQHWPVRQSTARSRPTLKQCRRQDVHYIPATRCVTTYRLLVEEAGSMPWPTIGVIEVTTTGLQHRLFSDDPQLPGLALAADAVAMHTQWAARSKDRSQERSAQLYAVTPVRYKPGSRCTFRYDLHTAHGWKSCFGKLLARDSAHLWQTTATLYQASQQEPELPRIAPPLAYWPELQMLFQAAVGGTELHMDAFDPKIDAVVRVDWLRAAGRCIAALHNYTGLEGPQRTFASDLVELDEYCPALAQANPQLANRFREAIASLEDSNYRHTEVAPVVSHGALRTDQFMIENDHLVLIDLDSVCWANPARDIGNFLAYLTWKALRQPQYAAYIRCAQQAFLSGYQTLRALPAVGWLSGYQAASLLKIVGRRYSSLTYQEWPLTEQLLDKAVKIIQGDGALRPPREREIRRWGDRERGALSAPSPHHPVTSSPHHPITLWLPTARIALDSAAMTAYLAPRLSLLAGPGCGWTVTHIELLDYKPGQRGLIRYELSSLPPLSEESQRRIIFGKLYADRSQLIRVAQVLHILWEDVFCGNRVCGVPQPLGVVPELSMLLYAPAEGQFLDEVITKERAAYAMELTAAWLGALHRHPFQLTKQFHLANELTNLAAWATVVGQTYPDMAAIARQALAYLQHQAAGLPLDIQTPIHKDFHYRHVLVGRGVKVIDFDEVRLGDPNFDLAHFSANLHLLAYRQHGSPHHLHNLEQQFLDAYARTTGWTRTAHEARFTYFYVYACLKVARQLCLGFGPAPVPTGEARRSQVYMILSQAAIAISNGDE